MAWPVEALVDVDAAVGPPEAGVALAAEAGGARGNALPVVARVARAVVHLRAVDA